MRDISTKTIWLLLAIFSDNASLCTGLLDQQLANDHTLNSPQKFLTNQLPDRSGRDSSLREKVNIARWYFRGRTPEVNFQNSKGRCCSKAKIKLQVVKSNPKSPEQVCQLPLPPHFIYILHSSFLGESPEATMQPCWSVSLSTKVLHLFASIHLKQCTTKYRHLNKKWYNR